MIAIAPETELGMLTFGFWLTELGIGRDVWARNVQPNASVTYVNTSALANSRVPNVLADSFPCLKDGTLELNFHHNDVVARIENSDRVSVSKPYEVEAALLIAETHRHKGKGVTRTSDIQWYLHKRKVQAATCFTPGWPVGRVEDIRFLEPIVFKALKEARWTAVQGCTGIVRPIEFWANLQRSNTCSSHLLPRSWVNVVGVVRNEIE